MNTKRIYIAGVLSFSLFQQGLTETITLLESFENGVDHVEHTTDDPGTNPDTNRRVTGFNLASNNDLGQITHGDNALQVEFNGMSGWQRDFRVVLSPEATEILQEVIHTDELGRYYLAYDITWETLDASVDWANQPLEIGGWQYGDQLEWNGGSAPITMAYELAAGTPEGFNLGFVGDNGDQTFIGFIFNGNAVGNLNVYVDNIRLIDTKLAGAETKVTLLQSFEGDETVITPQGRAEGPVINTDSTFISHGEQSARIALTGDGGWAQDMAITLDSSALLEALELPRDQRYRYTLAWDWFSQLDEGASAGWFQQSVFPTPPGVQLTQPWAGNGGMRTRAINLGMVDWDTATEFVLTHNSNWSGGNMNIYLDNVRLIDHGYVPSIFSLADLNHQNGTLSFSWNSSPGKVYKVLGAETVDGDYTEIGEATATSALTTFEDEIAGTPSGFYQVLNVPAPPIFEDDLESGGAAWTTHVLAPGSNTTWELGSPGAGHGPGTAHSGQNVYGTDLDADYEFNTSIALRSPVIDLSGLQAATLIFWSYQDVEPLFDGAFVDFVEIFILDANNNDLLGSAARRRSGTNAEWSEERLRIPAEALGQPIRIEFRFTSDDFNAQDPTTGAEITQAGWFIDDVSVIPE